MLTRTSKIPKQHIQGWLAYLRGNFTAADPGMAQQVGVIINQADPETGPLRTL